MQIRRSIYRINNSHKHHKLKLYKIFKTHTNTKAPFWHGIENTIHTIHTIPEFLEFLLVENSCLCFINLQHHIIAL